MTASRTSSCEARKCDDVEPPLVPRAGVTLPLRAAAPGLLHTGRGFPEPGARSRLRRRLEPVAAAGWVASAFTVSFNGVRLSSAVSVGDAVFAATLVVTIAWAAAGGRKRTAGVPVAHVSALVWVGGAALVAGATVATVAGQRTAVGIVALGRFVFDTGGSLLGWCVWAPDRRQLRWFCTAFVAGGLFSAAWAWSFIPAATRRPMGLDSHPNDFGIVCVVGAAIAAAWALVGTAAMRRPAAAATAVLAAGVVASGSRSALVGLAAAVPVVAACCGRTALARGAAVAGAVVAVVVLAGVVRAPHHTWLGRFAGDRSTVESDAGRTAALVSSLERVRRHPLAGEGLVSAFAAHDIYLQAMVIGGPLGLAGLVAVATSVVSATARAATGGAGPGRERVLVAGLGAGYCGYLVAGLFQNNVSQRYAWLVAAATLSAAAGLRSASRSGLEP